jgi:hypothetical protein
MDQDSRRRFIAEQPEARVQKFARLLGWNDLRLHAIESPSLSAPFIAAYWTTDARFNLQITRCPNLGETHYQATVVAERFGITAVPHQAFQLFEDAEELMAEALRLRPWLGRSNFRNRGWRQWFAERHPIWIMRIYRQRNKTLNRIRRQANALAASIRRNGVSPYGVEAQSYLSG